MRTLVYFVDGPNGAGKDYFINELVQSVKAEMIHPSVEVLRATDFFDNKDTASERRKYVQYDTEQSKTLSIVVGHFKLLERIAELAREQVDVIIVNRSFLSTLSYNLYKQSQLSDRRLYLDLFMNLYSKYSYYVDMTFVNMVVSSNELKIRQEERREGKPIDMNWNIKMIDNYARASADLSSQGARVEHLKSGQAQSLANEILKFKKKESEDILAKHFLGGGSGG